ncbi:peptidase M22 [Candidatus Pelagibacter sp.]|jgi:tRNA threonylcarbamoyladenosine biosynthesis protein TsaB|nr:peptidase M22 [Candidatus Pelagibacter sp.]
MNSLIIDAAADEIFLTLISNKNIYTCRHENSKSNFERLTILINKFLKQNKILIGEVNKIYVNRGPGSFAGVRNSLSVVKALFLIKNIDYYCFSFLDFNKSVKIRYEDIPNLCIKFKIKKNLINPIYLS